MAGTTTIHFKNRVIEQFINDVRSGTTNYYITFGKNFAWPDDMNPPAPNRSMSASTYQLYQDMLFGKKVSASDVIHMTKRVDWVSGTVYAQYDDQDPDLYLKDFYVINRYNRVYKCLFNNYGSPSTVEPQQFNNNGDFNTADGYKWKYMYRVTSALANKFMSANAIPVKADAGVVALKEPGAIHTILVENSGIGYIGANGVIEQVLDPYNFKIANSSGVNVNGAYNLSTFYLTDALGNYNDEKAIVDGYTVNSSGKFIRTQTPISIVSSGTLIYRVGPQVEIRGDGFDAFAVAYVNSITNGIYNIEVIDRGYNYTYSTINIIANTNFGSGALARAIISPPGGHAANTINELGADIMGLSVETDTTDNFPDWISYRQVSLISNPTATANNQLYQNTTFTQLLKIDISNVFDIYPEGEIVTGINSGATGVVVYQTTTELYLGFTTGSFTLFETLVGTYTGYTCTVDVINNRDLIPNTGPVLYYRNFIPISRIGLTSEQVKLYFKI